MEREKKKGGGILSGENNQRTHASLCLFCSIYELDESILRTIRQQPTSWTKKSNFIKKVLLKETLPKKFPFKLWVMYCQKLIGNVSQPDRPLASESDELRGDEKMLLTILFSSPFFFFETLASSFYSWRQHPHDWLPARRVSLLATHMYNHF